jgi:hypothetical protein
VIKRVLGRHSNDTFHDNDSCNNPGRIGRLTVVGDVNNTTDPPIRPSRRPQLPGPDHSPIASPGIWRGKYGRFRGRDQEVDPALGEGRVPPQDTSRSPDAKRTRFAATDRVDACPG